MRVISAKSGFASVKKIHRSTGVVITNDVVSTHTSFPSSSSSALWLLLFWTPAIGMIMLSGGVQDHFSVLFDQFRDEILREYIHPLKLWHMCERFCINATLAGRFVRGVRACVIGFLSSLSWGISFETYWYVNLVYNAVRWFFSCFSAAKKKKKRFRWP